MAVFAAPIRPRRLLRFLLQAYFCTLKCLCVPPEQSVKVHWPGVIERHQSHPDCVRNLPRTLASQFP